MLWALQKQNRCVVFIPKGFRPEYKAGNDREQSQAQKERK